MNIRQRKKILYIHIFILILMSLVFIDFYNKNFDIDLYRLLTFINISSIISFHIYIYNRSDKILSFKNIDHFYSLFFVVYFIIPTLISSYNYTLKNIELAYISFLICLAYFSFFYGIRRSKLTNIISPPEKSLSGHTCKALLSVCIILVPLIIYYFYWRITENIFFNQAFSYEQRTDLLSSIRDVFIQSIILPLIIIIGLTTRADNYNVKKFGIKFLWLYSLSIIVILTLSSQTRPAITAFILFFTSLGFYRKIKLNFRKLIGFSLVTLIIIVLIQSQRSIIKSELTLSSNQLSTAFDLAVPSTLEGTSDPNIYSNILLTRSEGNIRFLADIINKTNDDSPYLYGKGIIIGFSGLIPRVLYPDKPVITSPQIVVKQLLRLPLTDAALTPINQFYVEFGIIGVIAGFFVLGYCFGKYILYLIRHNTVGSYIFFAFVITHIVLMENEFFVGMLTTLRNAVIVYFIYLFINSNLIKNRS